MIYLYLAGLTALLWSISGIIIKGISSKFGNLVATALIGIGNVIVLAIVVLFLGNISVGTYAAGLSVAAGIVTGTGYILFYRSLQHQRASNTYSIIEIQVVILFLYGALVLGETVSLLDIIGIAVIILGTIAVSIEKMKFNIGLLPAMGAQVFWALGWILLVYPISVTKNFVLPNLISFSTTLAMVCVLLALFGKRIKHKKKIESSSLAVGVSAGLASGSGNAVYTLLIYMKDLALSAPIANSTPVIIAVIARFVYKERLSAVQYLGIVAVVIGAAVLTI